MSAIKRGEDRPTGDEAPWACDTEPEPEWAGEIRRGRWERGRRLREIFAGFGDAGSEDIQPERMPPQTTLIGALPSPRPRAQQDCRSAREPLAPDPANDGPK